ncbi:hypothetical protein [Chryseolinea lacunae]|uniref:Uncharacterized protein n=1 Tax=Chryseolinea lacunae TaxID=2801331 RepID=A0ABS1KRT1_9BACT|nr:hypothetical protein [Chryseolinea lacunae]MBL0740991.1 hypothetical protein [Chryseolinea lacunae]
MWYIGVIFYYSDMERVNKRGFDPKSQCPQEIIIPIASKEELQHYQHSILHLLSKVEVNACDAKMKESVKGVYKLLSFIIDIKPSNAKDIES